MAARLSYLLWNSTPDDELLALDEAMRRMEDTDKPKADVVMLRYFAGMAALSDEPRRHAAVTRGVLP